jgi:hypothetical protein
MRTTIRLGLAMAVAVAVAPALAHPPDDDPYAQGSTATTQELMGDESSPATPESQAATAREGAGGMEPGETQSAAETREERDEREFVNGVWNSP